VSGRQGCTVTGSARLGTAHTAEHHCFRVLLVDVVDPALYVLSSTVLLRFALPAFAVVVGDWQI
jgi:hypothetical protein